MIGKETATFEFIRPIEEVSDKISKWSLSYIMYLLSCGNYNYKVNYFTETKLVEALFGVHDYVTEPYFHIYCEELCRLGILTYHIMGDEDYNRFFSYNVSPFYEPNWTPYYEL